MYRSLFAQSPLLIFPLIALGLFLGAFLLVVLRTLLRRSPVLDELARLPLGADEGRRAAPTVEDADVNRTQA